MSQTEATTTDVNSNINENKTNNEDANQQQELPPLEEGWEDLTKDRGVLKKILAEGHGEKPANGSKITCHYVGTLTANGDKFDSSRDRNDPFTFDLGKGRVIKGWDIGIATMKIGEKSILRCAPEYAYGPASHGGIPANSHLDFEVELLDWDNWETLSGDKDDIKKRIVTEGEGYQTVDIGAQVTISYTGKYTTHNNVKDETHWKQFVEEKNVQLIVDDDQKFVPGFHVILQDMKKSSKVTYIIGATRGYGHQGNQHYGVPPNATLIYEITLHEMINPKKTWELSTEEHFTESEQSKAEGNEAFKQNNYSKASKKYKRAIEILEDNSSFDDEQKKKSNVTLCALYNNMALIYCKQHDYSEALEQANKVLSINSNDVKGLTRRGQSNLMLGNPEDAKPDLKQALKLKPDNYIEGLLKQCDEKIKQYNEKQKALYANMFKSKPKKSNDATKTNSNEQPTDSTNDNAEKKTESK